MKKLIIAAVALAASLASSLAESPYCLPRQDGTDRIQKTGSTCPVGYFSSGRCCEALHKDSPKAFPKIKGAACPSGTFASGDSCVSLH